MADNNDDNNPFKKLFGLDKNIMDALGKGLGDLFKGAAGNDNGGFTSEPPEATPPKPVVRKTRGKSWNIDI